MMMRAMNQEEPGEKKVLELNPAHPLIASLEGLKSAEGSTDEYRKRVEMVLELARVLSGSKPGDPVEFGRFVADLMAR